MVLAGNSTRIGVLKMACNFNLALEIYIDSTLGHNPYVNCG